MKTYVVGTHQKHLHKVLLMSTHNICFHGEIRKNIYFLVDLFQAFLSNFLSIIDHKSRMTQIERFEFHFFIICQYVKIQADNCQKLMKFAHEQLLNSSPQY